MKKTLIGLTLVGSLVYAGQASADTLATDISTSGYLGPVNIQFSGNSTAGPTATSFGGFFSVSSILEGNAGTSPLWQQDTSTANPDYIYIIVTGFTDSSVPTSGTLIDGYLTGTYKSKSGSFTMVESKVPLTTTDMLSKDMTDLESQILPDQILLKGHFVAGAGGVTLTQILSVVDVLGTDVAQTTGNGNVDITSGSLKGAFGPELSFSFTADADTSTSDQNNGWYFNTTDASAKGTVVPEPATMLLFGTGLIGLAGIARRKFEI